MHRIKSRRLVSVVAAIASVITLSGATASAAPAPAAGQVAADQRIVLQIIGAVQQRLRLGIDQLEQLPQQTVTVTYQSGSGSQTHTYVGPLLSDVLNLARPDFDPAVRNDKLRYSVTATGGDGYQAAVAWAEFDPDFAGKNILVAVTEDGTPMADGRPRLVVPGDLRGGRYVSGLVRLRLSR